MGAAHKNLEETVREGSVVTCTGTKCMWKKKKRTNEEVTTIESMDFTKPALGKNKNKKTVKPKANIFDQRPTCLAQEDIVKQFQQLLLKCQPSAVALHILAEPDMEEAGDPGRDQATFEVNEHAVCVPQESWPEPFSIEIIQPLPEGTTLPEIKNAGAAVKRKLGFSDEEITVVEKKTRLQSNCAEWYKFKKGRISASKCKRVASLRK